MKTTIALAAVLLAVSSFATAEDISLAWGDDFNTETYRSDTTNKVGSSGYSYKATGWSLKSQNITDVDTSAGFTVAVNAIYKFNNYSDTLCAIHIKDTAAEDHPYEIIFDYSAKKYSLVKATSGGEEFGAVTANATDGLEVKVWYSLFLTVKGSDYTLTTMSMDGEVISSVSGILADDDDAPVTGSLSKINLGDESGSSDNSSKYVLSVDNFGVYNGVLSTEQMKEVTQYEVANSTMPTSVKSAAPTPEPTTATLSLLALAALAARRRRH